MQLLSVVSVALAAMLTTPALACKCFSNGSPDTARTQSCCGELNGIINGDDCAASSISEHLSDFRSCCGGQSDCDYPKLAPDDNDQEGVNTMVVV